MTETQKHLAEYFQGFYTPHPSTKSVEINNQTAFYTYFLAGRITLFKKDVGVGARSGKISYFR